MTNANTIAAMVQALTGYKPRPVPVNRPHPSHCHQQRRNGQVITEHHVNHRAAYAVALGRMAP